MRALLDEDPTLANRPSDYVTYYACSGTPLRNAAGGGHRAVVELLLERLAVVSTGDPDYLVPVVAGLRDRLGIGAVVGATGYLDAEFADALALLRPRILATAIATGSTTSGSAAIRSTWNPGRACVTARDCSGDFGPGASMSTSNSSSGLRSTRSGSLSVSSFCTHSVREWIHAPLFVPARAIMGIALGSPGFPSTSLCAQPFAIETKSHAE